MNIYEKLEEIRYEAVIAGTCRAKRALNIIKRGHDAKFTHNFDNDKLVVDVVITCNKEYLYSCCFVITKKDNNFVITYNNKTIVVISKDEDDFSEAREKVTFYLLTAVILSDYKVS